VVDRARGNLGSPFKPEEMDQFLAIIKGQRRRIKDRQLDQHRKSLQLSAEPIEQQSRR
jgi:hypothetical protein